MKKKSLSLFLAITLVLSCLPTVFAGAAVDPVQSIADQIAAFDYIELEEYCDFEYNGFLTSTGHVDHDADAAFHSLIDAFNALTPAQQAALPIASYSRLVDLVRYYYVYDNGWRIAYETYADEDMDTAEALENALIFGTLDQAAVYVAEVLAYVPDNYGEALAVYKACINSPVLRKIIEYANKKSAAVLKQAGLFAGSEVPEFWVAFMCYKVQAGGEYFSIGDLYEVFTEEKKDYDDGLGLVNKGIPAYAYVADAFDKAVDAKNDASKLGTAAAYLFGLSDAQMEAFKLFNFTDNGVNPYQDYILAAYNGGKEAIQAFINAINAIPKPYSNASIPVAQAAYNALPAELRTAAPADLADALATAIAAYKAIRANVGPDAQIDNQVDVSAYTPAQVNAVGNKAVFVSALDAFAPVLGNVFGVSDAKTADALVRAILSQKILTNDNMAAIATKLGVPAKASYGFVDGDSAGFFNALAKVFAESDLDVNDFVNTVDAESATYNYHGYEELIPIYEALEFTGVASSASLSDRAKNAADPAYAAFKAMLSPIASAVSSLSSGGIGAALDLLPRLAYVIDTGMLDAFFDAYLPVFSLDLTTAGVYAIFADAIGSISLGEQTVECSASEFEALVKTLAGCASAEKKSSVSICKNRLGLNSDSEKAAVVLLGVMREKAGALAENMNNSAKSKFINAICESGSTKINLFDKLAIRLQFSALTKAEKSFTGFANFARVITVMLKTFAKLFK